MRNYAEKHDPNTNECIFGSLNSSDWWKNADAALTEDLNKLGNNKPKGFHYVCPIIGFDDSTLCYNIGRLMAQPFLATVGNLSDESHCLVDSWFILGMVPPYPKSSKEREKDCNSKLQQESYIQFYHDCLDLILTELKQLSSCKEGVPVEIPGEGIANLHFRLCMIFGDTKGHDNMCCQYNNHSRNICQMVRDCDIHQADGDDPDYPCMMVEQQPIDEIVTAAMLVVKSRDIGAIGPARHSCREILQHLVHPVFFDTTTDGSKYGIFGCLPWELLHLYSLGILKYLLHAVYNY